MAKVLKDAPVTTAAARERLTVGTHWRAVDPDIHLGYRKGTRGGVWVVRWRAGVGYKQAGLGTADDVMKVGTLSYSEASKAARQHVEGARLAARAVTEQGEVLTVASAVESYIRGRDQRHQKRSGRTGRSDASQRLGRYLLGDATRGDRLPVAPIAARRLCDLTESDLAGWLDGLPASLKRSSRQRLLNDFRAALNGSYEANRSKLPKTFPEVVRAGLRLAAVDDDEDVAVARENQVLSDADVVRLIRAAKAVDEERGWGGDLYRLVVVLAATGARMSQLTRLRVRDFQHERRRILVPRSRKGIGKEGTVAVPLGSDVLETLAPAVAGRPSGAPLLERGRHRQDAGGIEWRRDRRGAWQSASEVSRDWARIRGLAGLPEAVPYAFRHSSIVRAIRANLPVRLVADIHDTSVAMIEKHYSRWISSELDELAARAVVPLVSTDDNVVVLRAV